MSAIFHWLQRRERRGVADRGSRRATREVLIVPTDSHVSPRTLADTVSDEALSAETRFVWVLLPVVVPPTLPIGAVPPRIAARLEHLRESADTALRASDARGRVEVVPCRSLPALLAATGGRAPALLAATGGRDRLVLVGRAGWPVRRAAHGLFGEIVVVPPQPRRSRPGAPAAIPSLSSPANRS
jgi:hypothetical protein